MLTQAPVFEHRVFGVVLDLFEDNMKITNLERLLQLVSRRQFHVSKKYTFTAAYSGFLLIIGGVRPLSITPFICVVKWQHEIYIPSIFST